MTKVDGESIIGGALALIATFAWRDAITETIDTYYPIDTKHSKNLQIKYIYAIVITLFVFLIFGMYITAVTALSKVSHELDDFMNSKEPMPRLPSLQRMSTGPLIKWKR